MLIIPVAALAVCLVLAYGVSTTLFVRERKAEQLLASRDACRISGATLAWLDADHDADDVDGEAARREWSEPGFDFYSF